MSGDSVLMVVVIVWWWCNNRDSSGWIICLFHLLSTQQVRKASQLHSGTQRSCDCFPGLPLAAAVCTVNEGHHR